MRVRQRTCQVEMVKKVRATEEPWLPVAPTTTIIFLFWDAIVEFSKRQIYKGKGFNGFVLFTSSVIVPFKMHVGSLSDTSSRGTLVRLKDESEIL